MRLPHFTLMLSTVATALWFVTQSSSAADPQPDESMRALEGKFVDFGYKATWSHDGKRLAYGASGPEQSLKVFDVASGKTTTLVAGAKDPSWQPGEGEHIAYVRGNGADEQVRVIGVDGKNDRKVADGGMPSWSKRGTVLFYHSRKLGQIMAADVTDNGDFAEASPIASVSNSFYPALNPQTTHVATIVNGKLTVADQLTGEERKAWQVPGAQGGTPTWSHDGKLVSAAGFGGTDKAELYLLRHATGESARLAGNGYLMPAWSPDGEQIAVDHRPQGAPWAIWIVSASKVDDLKWGKEALSEAPADVEPAKTEAPQPEVPKRLPSVKGLPRLR
jgi:Tol biopolymer transport system component